jgi:predicted DsbA family dithiol-disulfide isomerase
VSYVSSNAGAQRTRDEIADGMDRGVSAVPTFVFDGKWSVPGAQDPDTFVRVLGKLFEQAEAEALAAGETCAVDGTNC